MTHRLLRLLHASQGRSLRLRMLVTVPVEETGLTWMRFSFPDGERLGLGRAAAMGTGEGRGMAG
jgi:hypothetical protein